MAFDIYGQPLRRGHCEVHPDVWGEYPCALCITEQQEHECAREHDRARMEEYERQLEEDRISSLQGMHGDGI